MTNPYQEDDMTHRELFEAGTETEVDAPFDSVQALCDFMETADGPNVFREIYDAQARFLAAEAS